MGKRILTVYAFLLGLIVISTCFVMNYINRTSAEKVDIPFITLPETIDLAYDFDRLDSLVAFHPTIAIVEVLEKGEPYRYGGVKVNAGNGKIIDTGDFYNDTKAKVLKVLKGNSDLRGKTIPVIEYMGAAAQGSTLPLEPGQKYLLFMLEDESNPENIKYAPAVEFLTRFKIDKTEKIHWPRSSSKTISDHPLKEVMDNKDIKEIEKMIMNIAAKL